MRKSIILPVITAIAATAATAQTTARYELQKYGSAGSSYEADRPATFDIENTRSYAMYRHPALVGLSADTVAPYNALVQAAYSNENSDGDYLHYRGNRIWEGSLMAGGEMNVKGIGTLYGHASYGRGKNHGIYQSYAVRPEDYAPYFVSDSVSTGTLTAERYLIEGGLSMSHRDWRYGIGMFYEGIDGSKDTQPRRSVYSYWFRISLSAARITPQWILSAKVWPELSRQSTSASSPVQTFRVLQFYGFGQWNRKESTTGYSYARDSKISGAGGELLFCTNPATAAAWRITASAAYNFRRLRTEETSFKELFHTSTHHLNHTVSLTGNPWGGTCLSVLLTGEASFRSGQENVYERQRQDEDQSLYDYVKVGSNNLYNCSRGTETLLAKATWNAAATHTFGVLAGVTADWYRERYDMPEMTVENRGLTPQGGVGYTFDNGWYFLDLEVVALYRMATYNRYAVPSSALTQFETAQAYIPYLLRGENRWQLQSSLVATRRIGRGQLGASVGAAYGKRTDAPYVAGRPDAAGISHRRLNFDASIFYMF